MGRPCPKCGAADWKDLTITDVTLGNARQAALAGEQIKFVAQERVEGILSCKHCDFSVAGVVHLRPGQFDTTRGVQLYDGEFVAHDPRSGDTLNPQANNDPGA